MPKYRVLVTRDTTESATVEVEADNPEQAMEVACSKAMNEGAAWEVDDNGNQDPAYIADEDNCWEEVGELGGDVEPESLVHIEESIAESDGTRLIHIDTPDLPEDEHGPLLRVYLNDEVIYENPAYPGR